MERLFAALDLPDPVRDGLAAWSATELVDPALRPVRPEALHMTVCFLGWTPPERVDEAVDVIRTVEPHTVTIKLLPEPSANPPRRPSLYAIEAEAPEASALAGELTTCFVEQGLAHAEHRPFWPHLTVARVRAEKGSGRGRRKPQRVERTPGPLPGELGGEFHAVRLSLYRSMMRRDGSQYVPLYNVNLR